MKNLILGLIILLSLGTTEALDIWGESGGICTTGTNAEGDYSEAIAEFANGGIMGYTSGSYADATTTGVEQEGLMFTDGGEAQAMVYASDEAGIEASALTEVDDFTADDSTYGFAAFSQYAEATASAEASQDAMASVEDGAAISSTYALGSAYTEVFNAVNHGYYETSQNAFTDGPSSSADQNSHIEGLGALARGDGDFNYGMVNVNVAAGAEDGIVDTYQEVYADTSNYADAFQDTYAEGLGIYTAAFSSNNDAYWQGSTEVGTHEETGVTEIEAGSYADADFGDSRAWQEVFMSGSAGYAYANAFSDYPVDAEAHLNLPYIAGGLFGGMDAYQNGLAATTSVW